MTRTEFLISAALSPLALFGIGKTLTCTTTTNYSEDWTDEMVNDLLGVEMQRTKHWRDRCLDAENELEMWDTVVADAMEILPQKKNQINRHKKSSDNSLASAFLCNDVEVNRRDLK